MTFLAAIGGAVCVFGGVIVLIVLGNELVNRSRQQRAINRDRWILCRVEGDLELLVRYCQHNHAVVATAERLQQVIKHARGEGDVVQGLHVWRDEHCPLPSNGKAVCSDA